MHKKLIIIVSIIVLIFCAALNSCQNSAPDQNPPKVSTTSPYEDQIKALEDQILALRQNQTLSDAESQAQIAELEALIDQLRTESTRTAATTEQSTPPPSSRSVFIYTLEEGKAIITGFTGDDEHIVIPAKIDGIEVYGIASSAFEDYPIKSVIISEGVEVIDWFAFYRCSSLESVTVPASVRRIGHSAFEGCSLRFTIYCHDGSFAQNYAQSYGITYAII